MAHTDHLRYRQVLVHAMDVLRDCSPSAERLYLRMATGAHSTRVGIVARPTDLTKEARLREADIDRALLELAAAGLVTLSVSGAAYLTGHCRELCPKPADNRESWSQEVKRLCVGNRADLLSQVLEEIDNAKAGGGTGGGATANPMGGPKERERERRGKEQNKDTSSVPAKRTRTPAARTGELHPLIAAYNELCTSMAHCTGKPGSASEKAAIAAWNRESDLDVWRDRFTRAQKSTFLTGNGDTGFKADFIWIANPTNAEKIDLGRYDDRKGQGSHSAPKGNAPTFTPVEDDYDLFMKHTGGHDA